MLDKWKIASIIIASKFSAYFLLLPYTVPGLGISP